MAARSAAKSPHLVNTLRNCPELILRHPPLGTKSQDFSDETMGSGETAPVDGRSFGTVVSGQQPSNVCRREQRFLKSRP
jgi:hypothetical protein